jgi:hypothetical protein
MQRAVSEADAPSERHRAKTAFTSLYGGEAKVAEAFRTGAGVGWDEHCTRLFSGTEPFFRPGYNASLISAWIPSLNPEGAVTHGAGW